MLSNINEPKSNDYKELGLWENEYEEEVEEPDEEMEKKIDFFNLEDKNINGNEIISLFDRLLSNNISNYIPN